MNARPTRFSTAALIGAVLIATAGLPSAALAAAAPPAKKAPAPTNTPTAFSYHWCVTGRNANTVPTDGFPMIKKDVVTFYEHRLGTYPRILTGRVDNGGLPQKVDLAAHLARAKADIERDIPDPFFAGYAVIDYEAWCPIWSRTGSIYRNASIAYTKERNPELEGDPLELKAKQEFTDAAKAMMLQTIELGKRLRPRAKWGFYGYPDQTRPEDMNQIRWLFDASTAVFPSFYHFKFGLKTGTPGPGQGRVTDFQNDMRIMIDASKRLAANKPILGFIWMRYHENNSQYGLQMLNADDLEADMTLPKALGAQGVIVWDHLDDPGYTATFKTYVAQKAGPAIALAARTSGAAAAAASGAPVRTPPRPPTSPRP